MTGQGTRTTTYTLPNCTEQVSDDFSQCNRNECPPPSSVTSACPAGQTGAIVTTTSYVGVACTPVTNSTDNCYTLPPQCPSDSQQQIACPAGFTGSALLKTTYDKANNCARTDTVDNSGCRQNSSRLIEIGFSESAPEFGIIGSYNVCTTTPGGGPWLTPVVPLRRNKEGNGDTVGGMSCSSGGDSFMGFLLIPKELYENSIFIVGLPHPNKQMFINCMLYNNCSNIQSYPGKSPRDIYLKANGKDIFIINPYNFNFSDENTPGFSAFVRKGDFVGRFSETTDWKPRSFQYNAPFDGYLLVGGGWPQGWGSAN